MNNLQEDLKKLRLSCFRIESGLPVHNSCQVSHMTDAQSIRHELYEARAVLDRVIERASRLGVDYPPNPMSFTTIEPPEDVYR